MEWLWLLQIFILVNLYCIVQVHTYLAPLAGEGETSASDSHHHHQNGNGSHHPHPYPHPEALAEGEEGSGSGDEDESNFVRDINANQLKSQIFHELLNNYDENIRPTGLNGSGPVEVEVNLYMRSIENIDDVRMEYKVQLSFRQEWIDLRLRYSHLYKNINFLQLMDSRGNIWTPDLFFSNEKQGAFHKLMVPNVFTRMYPDGRVTQSYRISLLLSCPMNLKSYPLDEQLCPMRIASYGWTTEDIILDWRTREPIQMAREFKMARFRLKKYNTVLCESVTTTGTFGCILLQLTFAREFGFYMIQIYVPCSMLVIVSWVSFFLEPTAVEARISLGVTTILTIVTQTYGINLSAPPASYIKALDVWTATCQAMIFGAILQFAYVNYTLHFAWKINRVEKYNVHIPDDMELKKKAFMKAKKIDRASRIVFPLIFALFNITYWTGYLLADFSNISFEKLAILKKMKM